MASFFKKGRGLRDLRRRLSATVQGKLILHCKVLKDEQLSEDVNKKLTNEIFENVVEEIIELVPSEKRKIYYIPSQVVDKQKISCEGFLYDHYCNKRKEFIKLGLIKKAQKISQNDKVYQAKILAEDMLDDVQWLKNSFEPWKMVLEKWEQTHQARFQHYSGTSIQEIIQTFLPFKNKLGWNLIGIEFRNIYPDKVDNPIPKLVLEEEHHFG